MGPPGQPTRGRFGLGAVASRFGGARDEQSGEGASCRLLLYVVVAATVDRLRAWSMKTLGRAGQDSCDPVQAGLRTSDAERGAVCYSACKTLVLGAMIRVFKRVCGPRVFSCLMFLFWVGPLCPGAVAAGETQTTENLEAMAQEEVGKAVWEKLAAVPVSKRADGWVRLAGQSLAAVNASDGQDPDFLYATAKNLAEGEGRLRKDAGFQNAISAVAVKAFKRRFDSYYCENCEKKLCTSPGLLNPPQRQL